MNAFYEWLQELASPENMGYFYLGYAMAFVAFLGYCKMMHRKVMINWRYAGIVLGLSMFAFVTLQTQSAYSLAATTASEVRECQREFNQALRDRARIAAENDALSIEQREVSRKKDKSETDMWVSLITPADPGIAVLDTDNPVRRAYALGVVTEYSRRSAAFDNRLSEISDRQEQLLVERRNHPLPEPTCGK
jgi:hypothetical protein